MHKMQGRKILITGATGLIGRGLAFVLARDNEVHALARFSRPGVREEPERQGFRRYQRGCRKNARAPEAWMFEEMV